MSLLFLSTLLALPLLTTALPNVTAVPLSPGTCFGFPSDFKGGADTADAFIFVPSSVDNPALNNLPTYLVGNTLVVALSNTTAPDIFCCDHGGAVLDGLGDKQLLFPEGSGMNQMMTLESWDYVGYATGVSGAPGAKGLKPEPYSHMLNGVKQDGIFLGAGNVTTWAFGRLAKETSWRARLMGPGALELQGGEMEGFLSILVP